PAAPLRGGLRGGRVPVAGPRPGASVRHRGGRSPPGIPPLACVRIRRGWRHQARECLARHGGDPPPAGAGMTAPGPRAGSGGRGRANQRHRTRKDLLVAAAQLSRDGHKPSLEAVAEAARVSRATAYRYFPSIDALLVESALDLETPTPQALFGPGAPGDPVARLEAVDAAFEAMITANEGAMRLMLAETVRGRAGGGDGDGVPARQNRRTPLIDGALEPLRGELKPGALKRLRQALAVMIGTEAFIVCRDVLGLDEAEARRARRWAIRALVEAARRES